MGITGIAGVASAVADRAVDAYRSRLQAQAERRRETVLQANLVVSAWLAAVGMVVDGVALPFRLQALQRAVDEAIEAGDVIAAEQLRAELVAVLHEPPASARLLTTLADTIPALVARHNGDGNTVIEGKSL